MGGQAVVGATGTQRRVTGHLAVVVLLCAVHLALGWSAIKVLSPTYDEPVHLAAGYSFLKTGDYRMDSFAHAPFAQLWAALPQLVIKPLLPVQHPYWNEIGRYSYPFADLFLYKNRIDAEKILNSGRAMVLLLSLALGLAIYLFSRELFGGGAALGALFLWSFAPFFLANGTLVTTDLALTLFYFLSLYLFWQWWNSSRRNGGVSPLWTLLLGGSIGCALVSKHSAVALFPVMGGILLHYVAGERARVRRPVIEITVLGLSVVFMLLLVYRFSPLSEYYLPGMKKVMGEVAGGRSAFLMGDYSTSGWVCYFPVVFLLKTPLPLLLLLAVTPFVRRLWRRETILFLLWPAVLFFLISCCSTVQIGHRHILPVYPFLIVWASGLYPLMKEKKIFVAAGIILMAWYAGSTLRVRPWYVSYFNELAGTGDKGYTYLTDSNVDWGQGLKALAGYLKEQNVSGIYLSYFGTGDPHYYGIAYRPVGFVDNIGFPLTSGHRDGDPVDFTRQPRVLFAISATNLQATYYADKKVFAWLKEIPPEAVIAHSILVYDLSRHPEQYRKLVGMLERRK